MSLRAHLPRDLPLRGAGALRRRIGSSVRLKVVAGLAAAFVISSAVTVVLDSRVTRSAVRLEAMRRVASEAASLQAALGRRQALLLATVRGEAQTISSKWPGGVVSQREAITELAQAQRSLGLDVLQVLDPTGGTIASVGVRLVFPITAPAEEGRTEQPGRLLATADGRHVVVAFAPIRAGSITPVLLGGFLFDDALAYELRSLIDEQVLLVVGGRLVASTLAKQPAAPPLPGGASGGTVVVDGVPSIVRYVPLGSPTAIGSSAAIGLVAPEPLEALDASLARRRYVTIAVAVLIAAVLSWLLIRPITRHLVELSRTAGAIAEGKAEVPRVVRSHDEIGTLANTLARMRQLDEAKSLFVANAAHELRTPLCAISGLAETLALRRADLSPEDVEHCIQALHKRGLQLSSLGESLLDLSQIERGSMDVSLEPVLLARLVSTALETAPPPPGVWVGLHVPEEIAVLADRIRLEQVCTNLLVNAYRYGGSGVWIDAEASGEDVRVAVCDDGGGVPPELTFHLFAPFARGDNARAKPGSGLGLALVRAIVEKLGGRIWYESGHPGARFVFLLKNARAGAPAPVGEQPEALDGSGGARAGSRSGMATRPPSRAR